MKSLIYVDNSTKLQSRYLVPDSFSGTNEEIKQGIPVPSLDLSKINWALIRTTIHNKLIENELMTLADVKTERGNRTLHQVVCKSVVDEIIRQFILQSGVK